VDTKEKSVFGFLYDPGKTFSHVMVFSGYIDVGINFDIGRGGVRA
jgi:hypothetical protein